MWFTIGHRQPLEVAHQQATTNGKLRDKDMENTKSTNDHALHGRTKIIKRIVNDVSEKRGVVRHASSLPDLYSDKKT